MLFEEDTSLLFRTSSRKVIVRKDCRTRRRSLSWKQYSAFGDDPALIASETAPPGKKWIMKFGGIYWIEFFNRTSFSGDGERSGMKMVVFLWRAIVGSSPNSSDWKRKERVRWRALYWVGLQYGTSTMFKNVCQSFSSITLEICCSRWIATISSYFLWFFFGYFQKTVTVTVTVF